MLAHTRSFALALVALVWLPAALPAQNYLPRRPADPARAYRLAERLSEQAREYVGLVPVDLGPSWKTDQLVRDGNVLIAACDQFRDVLRNRAAPQQTWRAFQNLRGAFRDAADEVTGMYGQLPNANPVINVMAQHINALIDMGYEEPPPRPAPPPFRR